MASAAYRDPEPVIRALKGAGILNKHLQAMLKSERLPSNGVKVEMQNRVITQLRSHAAKDPAAFDRLKLMIENPRQYDSNNGPYSPHYSPQPNVAYNNHASPYSNVSGQVAHRGGASHGQQPAYRGNSNIEFKPSPFYRIKKLIDWKVCDRMDSHRHQVQLHVKIADHPDLLNLDPDTRVMVFCGSGSGLGGRDIAFPLPAELKVNGLDSKQSLRDAKKNKPGTTKPVDITNMLRLNLPKYDNVVEFVYALTKEKYYIVVNLVKMISVEDLVKTLAVGTKITKGSVVNEMVNKARDPDIVVGSSVLSLKCPLSTLRMTLPCRATTCRHNQCFDATSYLQLQQQAPIWQCPICSNPATFDNLAVDEYVREIIMNTPKSVDQVVIDPDGSWSQNSKKTTSPPHFSSPSDDDDGDDDIIEIKDSRVTALRNGSAGSGTPNSLRAVNTTPGSSREPSSSVGPQRQSNGKRPASAVIDLTYSDDDDDDVPLARPAKRMHYGASNGTLSNGSPQNGIPHRGGYLA